jgi:hypothetical protein
MDICFVTGGDYRRFLRSVAPESERPGPIVDSDGTVLGEHRGVATVTIGQRKGLGIALGEARHVIDVIPETATVVLGRRQDMAVTRRRAGAGHVGGPATRPAALIGLQYRAHGEAVEACGTSGRSRVPGSSVRRCAGADGGVLRGRAGAGERCHLSHQEEHRFDRDRESTVAGGHSRTIVGCGPWTTVARSWSTLIVSAWWEPASSAG